MGVNQGLHNQFRSSPVVLEEWAVTRIELACDKCLKSNVRLCKLTKGRPDELLALHCLGYHADEFAAIVADREDVVLCACLAGFDSVDFDVALAPFPSL